MDNNKTPRTNFHLPNGEKQLVINWHITDACNYACKYCYAKWNYEGKKRELIHDKDKIFSLLKDIYGYFNSKNSSDTSDDEKARKPPRLNLAGGEPLLHDHKIIEIADTARTIGFEISIISNGSKLNQTLMSELAPRISLLGISMDSAAKETNRIIGRIDKQGDALSIDALINIIDFGKTINPSLKIKINTVVNALNWHEDLRSEIRRIAPARWKVLKMLPVVTSTLAINDSMFKSFVERHASLNDVMRVEDNQDMTESYIMIDPQGRFFQNSNIDAGYIFSQPILDVGTEKAFKQIPWSTERFCSRYAVLPVPGGL